MSDEFISPFEQKMEKTIEVLKKDFIQIRTGKANPAMVEDIRVDYYGAMTPLMQLATISAPEPRMIMISPFDKSSMKNVEKAILASSLGLTPTNDGVAIRIILPELTGDRRKELAKIVKQKSEEKKVAVRNIRREMMDALKKQTDMSQDESKNVSDRIQKITDSYIAQIASLTEEKEKEITTV
ncbi:MAG: ribosome recycling factor [Leptospiraceae bacterium]|nr:ribosome recycling factor [Leptospiraceae bacterium]MCP5500818.1 ribosome recycling factor [Leptospiraceae bacterium]